MPVTGVQTCVFRSPAQAVADEIAAAGGEAVANTDDISSWAGAERLIATEDIEMMRAAAASTDLSPEAISPLVVWLGSAESREVTGRVFGVWGNAITVLEGWVNGPSVSAHTRWDPAALSAVIPGLVAKAAPNADTLGTRQPSP